MNKQKKEIEYIIFPENLEKKIPEFKLNLNKAKTEEQLFFQLFGYFASTLVFGILRTDEIVECDEMHKLYKNDKKEFLSNELRKLAFCNMTSITMEELKNVKR